MKIILLVFTLMFATFGAGKEPSEKELLSFLFVGRTHHFIIKTTQDNKHYKCYVINTSDDEIANAHSDAGMETIEAAHTPHPPKEPNEGEGIGFVYNGRTHHLIIKIQNGKTIDCYVITLSDAEMVDVHSDAGMRTIELKYLAMLSAATQTTVDTLNDFDKKSCGHTPRNGTLQYYTM